MRFTYLIYLLYILLFFSCKQSKYYLTKIEGKQISITDSLKMNSEIEAYIKPYKMHIEKDLSTVLAYAKNTYSKTDGIFNTTIGNYMADAVFDEASLIFKNRTGKAIDMVLLNHGGIRSTIPKGNITKQTAFEIMPFENSLVVVALKGSQVDSLITYLSKAKKAHPIAKLKLTVDKNFNIVEATINGNKIESTKTYYVATNDYLFNGGDEMTFFKPNEGFFTLNYKIRNALIDNFKKVDTINPVIDDRFIQLK